MKRLTVPPGERLSRRRADVLASPCCSQSCRHHSCYRHHLLLLLRRRRHCHYHYPCFEFYECRSRRQRLPRRPPASARQTCTGSSATGARGPRRAHLRRTIACGPVSRWMLARSLSGRERTRSILSVSIALPVGGCGGCPCRSRRRRLWRW